MFKKNPNWKPTPTVPVTPKISNAPVKGERNHELQVKSLSKPVNSIRKQLNPDAAPQLLGDMSPYESGVPSLGRPRTGVGHRSQASSAFYNSLQKHQYMQEEGDLIKLSADLTFDQARSLIHDHILDLDV